MKLIDVLNKQCNGEIRKGTKLIIDFSYEQDSPETYTYNGTRFIDESCYEWFEGYGVSKGILNQEVELIPPKPKKYQLRLYEDDDLSYVTRSSYDSDFNYDLGDENEIMEFKTKFTQEEIDNDKLLKFIEQHGVKEDVEDDEID